MFNATTASANRRDNDHHGSKSGHGGPEQSHHNTVVHYQEGLDCWNATNDGGRSSTIIGYPTGQKGSR